MDFQGAFTNRHVAPSDSRLLANLIKAERNYITHLRSSVNAAHGASSSLSAWGTSEAPDVADASARLANLLAACADVQNTHVAAIEGYRAALKDVADREASIRTVFRDRDILVSRLIKASQKSANPSNKKSPEERAEKVAKAQRELAACEEVLTVEEAALIGVKRRTFKEALTMRMKTMGDAGAAMVDAAKEAILLLDEFDSTAYQMPLSPSGAYDDPTFNHHYQQNVQQENLHPYHQYQQYHQSGMEDGAAQEQFAVNHPNFENSSVTPSQSASQIYRPNQQNRDSMIYNAPFDGIAEGDNRQVPNNGQDAESDSDEEDWRRSFGGGGANGNGETVTAHQGGGTILPAPHQLDVRAGTEADFVPHMFPVHSSRNNEAPFNNYSPDLSNQVSTPAPTPPAKDENKRLSRSSTIKKSRISAAPEKEDTVRSNPSQLNYVSMPPIPSAPRLDTNGVNLAPIPSAPKLYMPGASGAQEDSSDEEENGNVISHRGGGSNWNSRNQSRREDDLSSNEGITSAKRPNGARKSSFFGKMGRLFKGESKEEVPSSPMAESRPRKSVNPWDTRTDANLRNSHRVQDPSSLQRRQSALQKPLVPVEDGSSDEEQIDERNLVRHVNKGPPLWQTPKSNSDLGTGKSLIGSLKRPPAHSRNSSASVNVGPLSWKAHQELEGKSTAVVASSGGLARSPSNATTIKKKKKKKSEKGSGSVDGASEIGTQSTRTKPSSTTGLHSSIVVTGDASSGIRRSDSLNYGSMRSGKDSLAKRSSKRLSAMSTQTTHGQGNKTGTMGAVDPSGKFATNNWVAKSNLNDETDTNKQSATPIKPTPRHAAGKVQSSATTKPQPPQHQKQSSNEPPKHVPQPSRTMSPPLKPALKIPSGGSDLARSASNMSAHSLGAPRLPIIPAPISAPPPASTLLEKENKSALSIEEDKNIDGTGRLNIASLNEGDSSKDEGTVKMPRTALPRIDMPASEPFRVDYDAKNEKPTTPQQERVPTFSNGDPLLTPNEQKVYSSFLSTGENSTEKPKAESNQPEGVTRTTVARASVGSGVLGPKNVPPPKVSPQESQENEEMMKSHLPPKLSRSYSGDLNLSDDDSDEEVVKPAPHITNSIPLVESKAQANPSSIIAASNKKPSSILSSSHLHASQPGDGNERSPEGSGVGSVISRRKSVRMAPDVKLPPETPPADGNKSFGIQQSSSRPPEPVSKLSSRIAPPPPAPPRVTAHAERPIDLGGMHERTGWSTRIGMSRDDDSSDEEGAGTGENDYQAARSKFGSISKSWGKAVGKSNPVENQDGTSVSSKKKKRRSTAPTNSGYNPAIPLPAGMEIVGRSASIRRK